MEGEPGPAGRGGLATWNSCGLTNRFTLDVERNTRAGYIPPLVSNAW